MSDNAHYTIPKPPGRWRAITLALVMHVALFLFFWIGIRWQSETPLTVEAEIWDPQYKEAAPLPTPPQPEPQPVVVEPPQPQPQPQPEPKPVAPKVIDEPKVEKPDIALQKEKEKKRKEEQEKADKLKAEKEKADREKKEKLEADKQKKLKEEKQKEEEARKKADAEKQAAEKKKQQAAADAKAAEQRRQEDLKRMMGQATSATGGNGTAAKSQGPKGSPNYANKLRAVIRSNTVFDNSGVSGNPAGEYTVELFPDGTVRSVRVNKPSGVPGFDDAVRTAVMKSQPFPADTDGKVPSSFTFTHYPKDQ
ncbi:hypothetical protein GWL_06350 [Herbaspirillum sp. GW103]|uniref:cell envelope integrity protein TolA n=1 Tax=Herbaspirillum sp. GW103 TaxID=1175306 RepID=UPI00025E2A92|nr:cell envelope integrity protein TolA [Herbaspirillum sp. GW103]EIJ48601.1 hypothetical protein GWL_06350 [Herbaspirillum sp. GW103]